MTATPLGVKNAEMSLICSVSQILLFSISSDYTLLVGDKMKG
jgi:hypothetical protein